MKGNIVMNKERNHISVAAKGTPAPLSAFSTDSITDHYRTLMRTDEVTAIKFFDENFTKFKNRKVNMSTFVKPSVTIPSCTIKSTATTMISMDKDCFVRSILKEMTDGYSPDIKKSIQKPKKNKKVLSNARSQKRPMRLQKGWFKVEDQLRECVVRN